MVYMFLIAIDYCQCVLEGVQGLPPWVSGLMGCATVQCISLLHKIQQSGTSAD